MSRARRHRQCRHAHRRPRRGEGLYRVPEKGILFGVCYGVARYMGWSPRALRVVTFIACLLFSWPVLLYLAAAVVLPKWRGGATEDGVDDPPPAPEATAAQARSRFAGLDSRLARIEAYLHSEEYNLRQRFREIEA